MSVFARFYAINTKHRGKGSALQEATKVASEPIGTSGDEAASKRASKRRSPSPSVSPDNRPNPRFVERESIPRPGASTMFLWGYTPVSSEHDDDSVHSLASDHGDHSPKVHVPSESPAVNAKGSLKAGDDEEEKPLKYISLTEGLARAKIAKVAAKDAKPSQKRTASKSPLCEEKTTNYSYRNLFGSSYEEDQEEEYHI
ncbi:hypothetical protein PInf_020354 [Phytophthora infestans]|nr:hypothetical protein PInf_020354 [Phytophthora infestans]